MKPPTVPDLAATAASLDTLVASVETHRVGPAVKAFNAAIRRHGVEAAAAHGQDALVDLRARVLAAAPDRAKARGAILDQAWLDLFSTC